MTRRSPPIRAAQEVRMVRPRGIRSRWQTGRIVLPPILALLFVLHMADRIAAGIAEWRATGSFVQEITP